MLVHFQIVGAKLYDELGVDFIDCHQGGGTSCGNTAPSGGQSGGHAIC